MLKFFFVLGRNCDCEPYLPGTPEIKKVFKRRNNYLGHDLLKEENIWDISPSSLKRNREF